MQKEAQGLGIRLINLFDAFRSLSHADMTKKFKGHLSDDGNEFVATLIYNELKSDPAISPVLSRPQD